MSQKYISMHCKAGLFVDDYMCSILIVRFLNVHFYVCVSIQNHQQRLSENTESEPENHIPPDGLSPLFVDSVRENNQRDLRNHCQKRPKLDHVTRN